MVKKKVPQTLFIKPFEQNFIYKIFLYNLYLESVLNTIRI